MSDKASKDEIKLLKAQLGNLEVQVSEYQQIVKELSDKIEKYENKYGSVFTRASD
jgi:predicted  nucleic acid-binding Zn-ribbon protein